MAKRLSCTALAVDCLFVLVAIGVVQYVLPKRAMVFGRWRYSPEYDSVVVWGMMVFPFSAAFLREVASSLAKKKSYWKIFSILIVELIVVVALIPVRSQSRERANRVLCAAHLRQIGQAIAQYAGQHNGQLPPQFAPLLTAGSLSSSTFICPSSSDEMAKGDTAEALLEDFARPHRGSYVYCGTGLASPIPASYILAHDRPKNHEGDGINVLHGDGSVEWVSRESVQHLLAELDTGHNPPRSASATRQSHQ